MICRAAYRKMVRALVAVCNGSEEIETITPVDILRRAGAEVVLAASGNSLMVTLSRGVKIEADRLVNDVDIENWDIVVIPGGPGASILRDDQQVTNILKYQKEANKWIASICASPVVVLKHHGILDGVKATCYPLLAEQLPGRSQDRVVVDGKIITSQGPGTSLEFALQIVKSVFGEEIERDVANKAVSQI